MLNTVLAKNKGFDKSPAESIQDNKLMNPFM